VGFQAGAARRDITPPPDWIDAGLIWLWGYGNRSAPCTGVADPLDTRAVCIRDDDGRVCVLVTADIGALDPATTEQVRARLEASHGLTGPHVALNVSHTHSAPTAVSIPTWQPGVADARADYLALLADAIVGAVEDALAAMRPATIEFGRGTTNVAVDRHAIPGVLLDRTLDVVRITGLDGASIAVVFVAACHPTSFADPALISADFVSHARAGIEAASGGVAAFVQGYAGTCIPPGGVATPVVGTQLAADVNRVAGGSMGELAGSISCRLGDVELPLQPLIPGNVDLARGNPEPLLQRWAAWMDTLGMAVPDTLPTPLQAMTIGAGSHAWRLVASGHEVTTDLAARVRTTWPYERVSVAGYTNSQLSYLPSRAVLQQPVQLTNFPLDWQKSNYEGGVTFAWYGHRGPLAIHAEDVFLDGHRVLLDVGWTHIGHASQVVGLASWDGRLFAATANDKLWWRPPVHEDVPWHELGHAIDVTALTACDGALFCTTAGGRLWRRQLHGVDVPWEPLGSAPPVVSMTTVGSMLYAATSDSRLLRRDPVAGNLVWSDLGHAQLVAGLASIPGALIAATTDGWLHWRRPYPGDLPWRRYGRAQLVVGMTAIGHDLYAATSDGKLWHRPA
jgi:hypothetical protein